MRGCNNFCSYCIVPYTRGRERSRSFESIRQEVIRMRDVGYKEITLLGQNVNSYRSEDGDFADLLQACAELAPGVWFRFTTSHPKDISDKLIETMAKYENICKHIHLAMQSGSNRVLELMERKYTIEHYMSRIDKVREFMPDCALTTDIIAGFPGEKIEDHRATLRAVKHVRYDGAFMFRYSPREGTKSYKMQDDVEEKEKIRRLNQIIDLQNAIAKEKNEEELGRVHKVLVEGVSKRNKDEWMGRSSTNKVVIFPKDESIKEGDFIEVEVVRVSSATLFGKLK